MSNYNSTLQSNNTDLQTVLQTLQTKAAGGEQATPVISINSTTGLITATAGTKSATKQLTFQPAQTITPGTTNQTIPANTYLGGIQTIKGDVNLVASNIVSGKSIFGVVGTATAGGSSGDTSIEDALITRDFTTYTNDRVTSIGNNAFYSCSKLTSVNFPAVTSIGNQAFYGCPNLTSVNFPVVTSIGGLAFYSCSKLTSVNFPVVTTIGSNAFQHCSKLTSVSFPVVTSIGSKAFYGCSNLTSVVNFSIATTIGNEVFAFCSKLTSVNCPVATTIGNSMFYSCSNLTSVNCPVATTIGSCAFYGCTKLTSVNFPKARSIGSYAFYSCSKLVSIYLRASSVCKLNNSNAFSRTGIWSTKGSIFVPTSLVTSYKAATNWTYFSNRIFGV